MKEKIVMAHSLKEALIGVNPERMQFRWTRYRNLFLNVQESQPSIEYLHGSQAAINTEATYAKAGADVLLTSWMYFALLPISWQRSCQ